MNLSPISSSSSAFPSTDAPSSSSSSSSSSSTLNPHHLSAAALRRRSVDTGGLNLVVNDHSGSGSGRGYGGWIDQEESLPGSICVAELVVAMREETLNTIDQAHPQIHLTPPLSEPQRLKEDKYISALSNWKFDSSQLPLEEVLLCTMLLFELLWCIEDMEEDINLTFDDIRPFLTRVSKLYREGSSYHNFQHALDVLQATYFYLYTEGCIPCITYLRACIHDQNTTGLNNFHQGPHEPHPTPKRKLWSRPATDSPSILQEVLRNSDIFALFLAAIGHDVGHPGLSNAFMRNAKTPLAELFDEASVLEKMHSTLLLQTMRTHGMTHLLDRPRAHRPTPLTAVQPRNRTDSDPGISTASVLNGSLPESNGSEAVSPPCPCSKLKKWPSVHFKPGYTGTAGAATEFKSLLGRTILFTDMSLHRDWMLQWHGLERRLAEQGINAIRNPNGKIDPDVRLLLCQALIKCADISNPSRPFPACKHWSLSLIHEWAEQALLEKQLALPISMTTSDDSKDVAKVQIGFINMFALPLLEATSSLITAMSIFADQCRSNLEMWKGHVNGVPLPDVNADFPPIPPSKETSTLRLPKGLPDTSTMFSLSLPIGLHAVSSESASSSGYESISSTRHDENEMGQTTTTRTNGSTCSEPSSPVVEVELQTFRRSSYTELPQVTIPTDNVTFSSSQRIRTNSTTSTSPLFSPRSLATTSYRSDVSSPGPSLHAPGSTVSVHAREALRAAYDAHERPKARRWENRASWQGIPVTFSPAPNATLVNATSSEGPINGR